MKMIQKKKQKLKLDNGIENEMYKDLIGYIDSDLIEFNSFFVTRQHVLYDRYYSEFSRCVSVH